MIRHDDFELIVSCADPLYGPTPGYMNSFVDAAKQGKTVVHFTDQFSGGDLHPIRGEWKMDTLPWYDGRGNISFMTNDVDVAKAVLDWTDA